MIKAEGGNPHIGSKLCHVFSQAGLNDIDIRAEAIVVTPDYNARVPFILKMVWQRLLDTGVLNEADHNLETIVQQLDDERQTSSSSAVWDMAFLAVAVR